ARCHEAFSQAGLDPAQFNTANSTNDVVGLVASLGYDSFNLHGVSYGTRLALETMRRHPEANIRSVVLDSPAPPTEKRLEDSALALQTIVIRLFADCEANADCNAAYPNLVERTAALMAELAEQPITAGDQTIGADELRAQLVDLSATRANYVPRLIAELEAGDATTYLALLNGEVGVLPPEGSVLSAEGLNLIALISEGGMTAEDPFAGVKMVAEVLAGVEKESPRQAMKAIVQEKLADSEKLPLILEGIDRLTPDDLHTLQAQMSAPASEVDEAEAQKNAEAIAKNDAHFLLNGIVCLEQLPFEDVETVLAMKNDLVIPELATADSLLATEVGNCTNYPMGETDRTYHEPVTSQIPTLILQGEFDTRTPLQNGRSLSEQLSNDTLVIIPQVGHETWTSATSCVGQISINFISNPEQGPDLSCLAQRQEHFSLPDEPLTSSE
ncbi:MAG: alpha/beta hydrolase, partial [Candidatus Promineifilaceae bacterium]